MSKYLDQTVLTSVKKLARRDLSRRRRVLFEDSRKFKSFKVALVLLLVSMILTAYTASEPKKQHSLVFYGQGLLYRISAPILHVVSVTWVNLSSVVSDYLIDVDVKKENRQLHEEIAALKTVLAHLNESKRENTRLKKLLDIKSSKKINTIVAKVISTDYGNRVYGITLNKGSRDRLSVKSPVFSSEGVIGIVTAVMDSSSKVLLLTDPRSGIDVRAVNSRVPGVVKGRGDGTLEMDFVLATEKLEPNELIITSGLEGVFPPGLSVGRVSLNPSSNKRLVRNVRLVPSVNTANLEEVLVGVDNFNN